MSRLIDRFFERPPRNVGAGDFATRVVATMVLAALLALTLPQLKIAFPILKISLLFAAELGLVTLMLGLFLRTKTYFAGLQLLVAPLIMLWLAGRHLFYPAIGVGLFFLWVGITNLVTRRSRLNQVLNQSSLPDVIAKPAAPTNGAVS